MNKILKKNDVGMVQVLVLVSVTFLAYIKLFHAPFAEWDDNEYVVHNKDIMYTTPPRRGWHSLHWSGVIKTSARVGEGKFPVHQIAQGSLGGDFTCVCVCVLAKRPHAFTEPVFFFVLIT